MSTFLVTVLVVGVSIAAAVTLALNDPDQPATLRGRKRREPAPRNRQPRHRPVPAATAPSGARSAVATAVPATVEITGMADGWTPAARISPWLRIRSGFVLTILLAIVGALVAAAVAGFIVLIALGVRSAVG